MLSKSKNKSSSHLKKNSPPMPFLWPSSLSPHTHVSHFAILSLNVENNLGKTSLNRDGLSQWCPRQLSLYDTLLGDTPLNFLVGHNPSVCSFYCMTLHSTSLLVTILYRSKPSLGSPFSRWHSTRLLRWSQPSTGQSPMWVDMIHLEKLNNIITL